MNKLLYILLTWACFAATLVVNALANALPLNGYTTGQLSALYPNLFVPDGFTFSIWGILYLWLLVFSGYATNILLWLPAIDLRVKRVKAMLPWFWLSCLWNVLWMLAWHWLQPGLSLVIMLLLLLTLAAQFTTIQAHRAAPRRRDHMLAEIPFILYFGWICVATIANATAWLVSVGWGGWGIAPAVWAWLMVGIATGLAAFVAARWHRPAFTLVVAWAMWGIFRAQNDQDTSVAYAAIAGLVVCLGFALQALLHPKRGWQAPVA